ncbi:MAG: hypothetical protein LRY27_03655 [Chitinophagales bacterium]|nr:hypothetical protein [Chitinophagales bacterium]
MKKLTFTLLIACLSLVVLQAQTLTKQEIKQLKQEIKQLKKDPVQYKYLKENVGVKDVIIVEQNNDINVLKKDAQKKDVQIQTLNGQVAAAKSQPVETTVVSAGPDNTGYKYRVQLGLFNFFDVSSYLNDNLKYFIHEMVNGQHRYSIGNFTTLQEAEAFKNYMKKLGIKDAFVSEYQEGNRIK